MVIIFSFTVCAYRYTHNSDATCLAFILILQILGISEAVEEILNELKQNERVENDTN